MEFTLCSVQCRRCSVHCGVCSIKCGVCTVDSVMCTVHCALFTGNCALCTVQNAVVQTAKCAAVRAQSGQSACRVTAQQTHASNIEEHSRTLRNITGHSWL